MKPHNIGALASLNIATGNSPMLAMEHLTGEETEVLRGDRPIGGTGHRDGVTTVCCVDHVHTLRRRSPRV